MSTPIPEASGKLSQTYVEVLETFVADLKAKSDHPELLGDFGPAKLFAEYLDSFPTLMPQLQLMAMSKAREIDMEFARELVDALATHVPDGKGLQIATDIARAVNMRHMRKDIGRVEGTEAGEEVDQLAVHDEIDAVVAAGEAECANCSHPEYLHEENDIVKDVHCSAYAEAAVADCDCPGFKSPNEASESVS